MPSRRILLVDDDIAEISAVKRVLGRLGHHAELATNVPDAVAAIARAAPDLVVLGASCDGGDALALTHRIAEDASKPPIPVVLLGEAEGAGGIAAHLPRPVDPGVLSEWIQRLLASPAATAEKSSAPRPPASSPSRRAAAEALRARAAELRRAGPAATAAPPDRPAPSPPSAPAAWGGKSGNEPSDRRAPGPALAAFLAELEEPAPAEPAPADLGEGLDELLARAEAADRARLAQREARAAAAARAEAERRAAEARAEAERRAAAARAEAERRTAEETARHQRARAEAERRAAEEAERHRQARAEAERRAAEEAAKHEQAEAELRRAIESARAELEALRRRNAEETERRARAEAELRRLARENERRAATPIPQPWPLPEPEPEPEPVPDPEEEAARLRALAARRAAELASEDESSASAGAPPPPELRAGNLADLPLPRLLAIAARAGLSGRLDFTSDVARSVWFEAGRVVGAASAAPGERVDEVALRLGMLTRDQHRQVAGAVGALPTRHAARLLLDRGYLKPTELTALVRARTESVLFALFADTGAAFRWASAPVPAEERIALERGPLALAVEGIRRRWLAPQVDAVLGGAGTLLAPAQNGPPLAALALSPDERRVVALADGLRALDEIEAASPLDELTTRQVLAALVLVGALAIRIHQAGRPATATSAAIDLARVRDKLEQVRRADYFTILGLGRHCTPHEVRDAADRLTAEFDPARFTALRADGLESHLEEIRRVVADAREVLADDVLRGEYVRGLGG